LKNIKLIVYDFDGVMTNNKVHMDQNGIEMVQVNRADGLGVSEIKKLEIQQAIISTEKNPVVAARARKLAIPCLQGINNKKNALIDFCLEKDIELGCVAYVGNDINDLSCLKKVGVPIIVADAHYDVAFEGVFKTKKSGGRGAVREVCDFIYESIVYGEKHD